MEIGQVVKQLEWMDEERRRDKSVMLALQDKVNTYADTLEGTNQRMRTLEEEVKRLSVQVGRLNQFDGALVQQRIELRRMMDETEKKSQRTRDESEKLLRADLKALEVQISELGGKLDQIQVVRLELQADISERLKLEHTMDDVSLRLDDFAHNIEDFGRAHRLIEEGRRQDAKQIDGLQGEVIALRKRIDERRSELEALGVNLNRMENRLNEILSLEDSRLQEQQEFIEAQSLAQVERERAMREWIKRVEAFEKQGQEVQEQLQNLDATHRLVKRSQDTIEMVAERMERRINEITELQRLTEDRFRQEWTTFKGDDQKRWADYTLSQDERQNELMRQHEKLVSRLVQLEDQFHITRDLMAQLNAQTDRGLQTILTIAHDWVETYQRIKSMER